MATATTKTVTTVRKRRRFTAFTVNIVRLAVSILILLLIVLLFWKYVSTLSVLRDSSAGAGAAAKESKESAAIAQKAAEEARSAAHDVRASVGELREEFKTVKAAIEALPERTSKSLVDATVTLSENLKREAEETRKEVRAVDDHAKEIASRLSASEQALADMRKEALERMDQIRAETRAQSEAKARANEPDPTRPARERPRASPSPASSAGMLATNAVNSSKGSRERNSAVFPTGGRSKTFSKWDIENMDVQLAPVEGIHATLVYKNGLFKTWTRTVDVPSDAGFDIKGADQVIFWSDDPFWVSWKK
ncbi:MAG TPA: hypothetical protein VFQ72_04315 [Candidatus Paceibacterota bacterium]|nr:hypothetical protein [Candidatus Paceibacterota bacterium]